ncbi:cell division protein [uncultured Selenomonas sp.]|uniref:cell division protein n=1 Tax=uncultured Selenomonas sp. TaxID=159275 RepID=UPI0028EDBC32|nr:cell division protein [uncultured Selenomonas sp.]
MKSITCLLAAGILLLPASGMAAEQEAEIHAVMSAEEMHAAAEETPHAPAVEKQAHGEASAAAEKEQTESSAAPESALDQEMDAVGSEEEAPAPRAKETAARAEQAVTETTPAEKQAAETDAATAAAAETGAAAAAETGAAAATVAPAEPQSPADANDAHKATGQKHKAGKTATSKHAVDKAAVAAAAAAKREAYGKETAIEPITLKDGDWVFIEGDERRGWFFDRSHMKRNADGSVSYWQLILYNNLGRAQFAEAMKNADYEHLGYTMQRRVLSPKKDAISTYEILAYDGDNALITESSREGHRAVIRANTMTEKERDAVRQELRRKK